MPTRKYKSDKNQLLAEGQRIVSSTDDAKFQHKVGLVNLVLGGMTPSSLSEHVSESKNTITMWVKSVDENGFDSLRAKRQPSRPQRLSADELSSIRNVVALDDPKACGYSVRDGPSLSDCIQKTHGVKLCVRQCQRLLHSLVFSLVRPRTFPPKNKEGLGSERDAFKKTEWTRAGRSGGPCVSGRGAFPSDHFRHEKMGPERPKAQNRIRPGAKGRSLQWVCCPFHG